MQEDLDDSRKSGGASLAQGADDERATAWEESDADPADWRFGAAAEQRKGSIFSEGPAWWTRYSFLRSASLQEIDPPTTVFYMKLKIPSVSPMQKENGRSNLELAAGSEGDDGSAAASRIFSDEVLSRESREA